MVACQPLVASLLILYRRLVGGLGAALLAGGRGAGVGALPLTGVGLVGPLEIGPRGPPIGLGAGPGRPIGLGLLGPWPLRRML